MVEQAGGVNAFMSHISNRPYEGQEDFQILLDLMDRLRPPVRRNDYPVRVDLEESFFQEKIRANTRLYFDGGRPVAWVYVDLFHNLRWELEDSYEESLGKDIVEWGETCIRTMRTAGESATLDASCREDDGQRIAFLTRHGFRQIADTTVYMKHLLAGPIPAPVLPPGFVIRPISGKQEAEAVAAMHRAAFGTEHMTTESRLIIMSTEEYDPTLDLLVIAPDGSIAANCICSANEQQKRGFTDPISTHPAYRRMGLARALLLTGLRLLQQHGMDSAHLGTSGSNMAMQKTAESVGFKIEYKTIWFSKEVS